MQAREELYLALTHVWVGTAKRFLSRRHPDLWERDAARMRSLPEQKKWLELVRALDELIWQLPTYDQKELAVWEQDLRKRNLPSLLGLHVRWSKDYQRILKAGRTQTSYDGAFLSYTLTEFSDLSAPERAFLSGLLGLGQKGSNPPLADDGLGKPKRF